MKKLLIKILKKSLGLKSLMHFEGSYVIKVWDKTTGDLIKEYAPIKNLVVSSPSGYGINLIMRSLGNDSTYPLPITSASIGTGTTAPTLADTDLQTAVLTGIVVADRVVLDNAVIISFFINDGELANGTYKEFGIYSNGRLFARSLIDPVFVKGSNQNVSVDYTIASVNV